MKLELPLGKVCPSSLQWTIPTCRAYDDCKNVSCCKLRSGFEWWCMIRIGFSPKLAKTGLKNSVEMISGSVAASVRINIASIVFFNDSLKTIWRSTDSMGHTVCHILLCNPKENFRFLLETDFFWAINGPVLFNRITMWSGYGLMDRYDGIVIPFLLTMILNRRRLKTSFMQSTSLDFTWSYSFTISELFEIFEFLLQIPLLPPEFCELEEKSRTIKSRGPATLYWRPTVPVLVRVWYRLSNRFSANIDILL